MATGYPAKALELYRGAHGSEGESSSPRCFSKSEFKALLSAASTLKDEKMAIDILLDMEAAGLSIYRSEIKLACLALPAVSDATKDTDRSLQVILRVMRQRCLDMDTNLMTLLVDMGRQAEAISLIEAWIPTRSTVGKAEAFSSGMASCHSVGLWPVAHYLYDEANLLLAKRESGQLLMLRTFIRGLYKDQVAEHMFGLRVYRRAYEDGFINHWSQKDQKQMNNHRYQRQMNVHRYPFPLAKMAVEVVLDDMLRDSPGCHDCFEDLWMNTGAGKHSNSIGGTQDRGGHTTTLRFQLSKWLYEKGLHPDPEDPRFATTYESFAHFGRLRVRSMDLRNYLKKAQEQIKIEGPALLIRTKRKQLK